MKQHSSPGRTKPLLLTLLRHLLIVLAVLATLTITNIEGRPRLENGTYEIKEGNLLSQSWKVATVEFDVGEDLYFPIVIPCIHCYNTTNEFVSPTGSDELCVCDYASRDGCGEAPKGCPKDTCKASDVQKYCNDPLLESWTRLEYSHKDDFKEHTTLRSQHMVQDEVKYYRLQVTDPCRGYFLKLNFEYGMADVLFSLVEPEPTQVNSQRTTDFTQYPDHIELLMCPDDSIFSLGTLFFAVVGRSPNISFDIDIYSSKTLHSTPTVLQENTPCEDDDTYYCMEDGVAYLVGSPVASGENLYRFDVTVTEEKGECVDLTIFLHCFTGDGDILGTWIEMDFDYYLTEGEYPLFQAILLGSDVVHTQKCFDSPGVYPFYFDVTAWDPGVYYVSATTRTKSFLQRALDLSPYQYGYTAARYLVGTCPTLNLACDEWGFSCRNLWSIYPSTNLDPFWPIPPIWNSRASPFSSTMFGTLREHETPLLNPQNGKVSLVILMENNLFGKSNIYLTEDQLRQCEFNTLGGAFSKTGQSLIGRAGIRQRDHQCDYQDLKSVVSIGRNYIKQLKEATTFNKILQLTFQVNTLMFSTTWLSCVEFMNSMIDIKSEMAPTISTACIVNNTESNAYLDDPCCNSDLLPTQCCLSREISLETEVYGDIILERLEQECPAETDECATSYIGDYLTINQNSVKCTTFKSDEYPTLVADSVEFYRQCKEKYNIDEMALRLQVCQFDSDCKFGGISSKCNRVTNLCDATYELERAVLKCVAAGLDEYTERYLSDILGLTGHLSDSNWFQSFEKAVQVEQCIDLYGDSVPSRLSHVFSQSTMSPTCGQSLGGCSKTYCLDTSCEIVPSTCISLCGMNWIQAIKESENEKDYCERTTKCNWMGDKCQDYGSDCEDECEKRENFCGYCSDPAHCVPIPGIESEADCKAIEACYLPDGTIDLMSEEECKQQKQCSKPCHNGLSCESQSGNDNLCVSNETQDECDGQWSTKSGLCTYSRYSQSLCDRAGFIYYTCTKLTLEECQSCYNDAEGCPVNQDILQCHIVPRVECESKSQCHSEGGYCTDADWYTHYGNVDDDFGGCVESQSYDYNQIQPDCPYSPVIESLTPAGCYTRSYISEQNCSEIEGAVFRRLASSESDCVEAKGCDNYYQVNSLAPISRKECKKCGYEQKSYFEWTGGVWRGGEPIKLEWKKPIMERLHKWSSAVDFSALYDYLISAASATVLADLQSQALCEFNVLSVPIEVTSCACLGDESKVKSCFVDSDKPLETGISRPCIGLGGRVQTYESSVTIDDNAVFRNASERCIEVSLSTVSVYSYQQPEQVAFSPLTKVRDYNSFDIVKNDNDAIVGCVMSNGLLVEMDGELISYTLCLTKLQELKSTSKFDVWDLGVPRSDSKEFLEAMQLKSPLNVDGDTYCFVIEHPKQKNTYFLIERVKNPDSADGSLYKSEAIAWWVFAALYTFLAIVNIGLLVSHFVGFKFHLYFLGLFSFLTFMCIVRGIYFYLLAAQVFDEPTVLAVAYFLIEFPTLLYFTAFSCLGGFWLFLLFSHRQERHHRFVFIGLIVFNLILYLLFLVFIVLFQTLDSTSHGLCPGRVPENEDNTNQQTVSLVYQGLMAGVSLLLAIIVAVFGGKLFMGLKNREFENKIALLTVICAAGLLLHCAFILYLTATLEYNFVIIVLMIVLSEIVPIAWIIFQFSLLRVVTAKIKTSSKLKSSSKIKTSTYS